MGGLFIAFLALFSPDVRLRQMSSVLLGGCFVFPSFPSAQILGSRLAERRTLDLIQL